MPVHRLPPSIAIAKSPPSAPLMAVARRVLFVKSGRCRTQSNVTARLTSSVLGSSISTDAPAGTTPTVGWFLTVVLPPELTE